MRNYFLPVQQLNSRIAEFSGINKMVVPSIGWLKTIRTALGMTMEQLGNKLNVTKQAIADLEKRESEGSITLKSMKEVADAMDMKLVYGFVPKDGSLEALINRKANDLAQKIVMRTHTTMGLENQALSQKSLKKAIEERAMAIKYEMPKILWD